MTLITGFKGIEKWKWPLMTLTLNDTIELLKAILEECGVDCIVLIISSIVVGWTVSFPSFNAIKTHRISFALPQFSCSFYENLDKIYREIPRFTPFIQPLTPLVFVFWRGEKCHRSHFFLLLGAFFSSFLCKKQSSLSCHICLNNVIFYWRWYLAI